jgi:hypothetical protein
MDAPLNVTREEVVAGLGGEDAVKRMDHDTRADALEEFLSGRLDAIVAAQKRGKEFPTVAELADKVDTRGYRRGTGKLFMHDRNIQNPDPGNTGKVRRLQPMPEKPTLIDFFKLRFPPAAHLLQSARLAR